MNTQNVVMKTNGTGKERNEYSCTYLEGQEEQRLSIMVDATNSCQLNCSYCYYGKKGERIMDVGKVFRGCKNLTSVFSSRPKMVNIHYMGGEPLLAWDKIIDLNELAKNHFKNLGIPFSWSITSNLVDLDRKKTDHMIDEHANIHCSIDGPASIQDRNRPFRNGRGSFARVLKAIPLALQITPNDSVRVTVRPNDALMMQEISQELFDRGFNSVALFPSTSDSWTVDKIYEWQRGIADAYNFALTSYGGKKNISTLIRQSPRKKELKKTFSYCGARKGLWALNVDADLFFCHHMTNRPELAIINAAIASPEEIKAAIEISEMPPSTLDLPEGCASCPSLDFCTGSCWSDNLLHNGAATTPVRSECNLKVATVKAIGERMYIDPPTDKSYIEPMDTGIMKACIIFCDTMDGGVCWCDSCKTDDCGTKEWCGNCNHGCQTCDHYVPEARCA